ncbi:MAG: hypothetical protein KKF77_08755 [Proteobacteria bacterium]|nr:hypothetical protein [Pseudomonadota bacterium]
MEYSTLVGGLGIGGVVTTFVKAYLDNRQMKTKRVFEEKRDAYVNYLNVAAISQTMPTKEALWARTAAIERVRLCGNLEVVRLLEIVSNTPPHSPRDAVNELLKAMRADLSF